MPKSSQLDDHAFYQQEYQQGGTTDLPDPSELEELKRLSFAPIGRDYTGDGGFHAGACHHRYTGHFSLRRRISPSMTSVVERGV